MGGFHPPPPLSEFHFWFALISFIVLIRISRAQAAVTAFVSWNWFWVWEGRCWANAVLQMTTPLFFLGPYPPSPGCSSAAREGDVHQEPQQGQAGRTICDEPGLCEATEAGLSPNPSQAAGTALSTALSLYDCSSAEQDLTSFTLTKLRAVMPGLCFHK